MSDDRRSAKTQRQAGQSAGGDEPCDSKVSQKSDPGNYVVRDGKKLRKFSSKDLSTKEFRDMNRKSHMQARKRAKAIAKELGTSRAGLPAQLGNLDDGDFALADNHEFLGPRRYILDTGSSYDLIGANLVPTDAKEMKYTSNEPIRLNGINGLVQVKDKIDIPIELPEGLVSPYLPKSSPAVLSIGIRCRQKGYDFKWDPYKEKPEVTDQSGNKIQVKVKGYEPYFYNLWYAEEAPPAESISTDADTKPLDEKDDHKVDDAILVEDPVSDTEAPAHPRTAAAKAKESNCKEEGQEEEDQQKTSWSTLR